MIRTQHPHLSCYCNADVYKRRNKHPSARRLLSLIAAFGIQVSPVFAEPFKQIPITVNQLDSAVLPFLMARQAEMNLILRQCDVYNLSMRVTINQPHLGLNPLGKNGLPLAPGGVARGDAVVDELRDQALNGEIANGGYKIWVATQLLKDNGEQRNGATRWLTPSSVVEQQDGFNGDAHTWLHEIGHGLGLTGHSLDESNLMYKFRFRSDNATPSGNALTMTQCSKMYYFLGKLEAIHTRLFVQRNLLQPFSKMSYAVDEIDDPPVLKGTAADLHYASLTATGNLPEPGDDSFVAVVDVNGPILVFPSIDYNLWIDLDDNPQTGDPSGFDALVKLSSSSPTLGMLRVFSLPNSLLVYQSSADVEATSLDWTGPYSEEEASIGTSLSGQVPKTVLASIRNIATEVAFVATTDNGVASDMVGPKRLETDFADVPALSLSPDHTFPSSGIGVMGVRFSANVHYVLLFNDQEVASGTTTSLGQLSETVVVPSITPGDYVVEVITDDGAAALCLLRVGGTSVPAVSGLGIAMMSIALFAYGVWRVRRSEVGQR